jgi:hypothetical protein
MSKKRKNPLADELALSRILKIASSILAAPAIFDHTLRCPQCTLRMREISVCAKAELERSAKK